MAQRWRDNYNTTGVPSNDCLGMARHFFCAYKFPACYTTSSGVVDV